MSWVTFVNRSSCASRDERISARGNFEARFRARKREMASENNKNKISILERIFFFFFYGKAPEIAAVTIVSYREIRSLVLNSYHASCVKRRREDRRRSLRSALHRLFSDSCTHRIKDSIANVGGRNARQCGTKSGPRSMLNYTKYN